MKNGFKAAGLYPWNPDNIDFSKCLGKQTKDDSRITTKSTSNSTISMTRQQFQQIVKENATEDKEKLLESIFNYFQMEFPKDKSNNMNEVIVQLDAIQTEANAYTAVTEIENLDVGILPFLIADYDSETESQSQSFAQIVHDVEIHEIRESDTPMKEQEKQALDMTNKNQDFMDTIETLSETPLKSTPTCISEMKQDDEYDSPIKSSKKTKLKDVLVYAKTPIRKGVKTIERKPFVLTSRTWQDSKRAKLEDKKKKLDDIQKRKAERLLKKNQKAKKKVEPKKKIAIPETKKINVISDITLTETEKRCTKSILAINQNTTKEPQVFRTPENI